MQPAWCEGQISVSRVTPAGRLLLMKLRDSPVKYNNYQICSFFI